ncbi:VanZ like family protein [Tepidimonas alkaliphilus]|uniref:VanZ like family protein n=1 Tax=Tepidimonas alkaliphilus TaxID=2588942 RepID=A0A554W836_9BURK|nr:VanZ family protein [Tepidimonas alkaliphilus]TSE19736.1 VanZ like family protein [Tepidimonas alkaliphilus]
MRPRHRRSSACPPSPRRVSLAWPLLAAYAALVFYASLYPFEGWRDQGVPPWAYLTAPWPRHLTRFDALANLLGYIPLGLLLTVALARSGGRRWSAWAGGLLPGILALALEGLQTYLPRRVPSQADALLNATGAVLGALLAVLLLRGRWLGSWTQFRQSWQQPAAQPAWALLLLWPAAVLVPAPVPLGLGYGGSAVWAGLQELLQGTPWQGWLPEPSPLAPPTALEEAALLTLTLTLPLLLGQASLRRARQRLVWALTLGALAMGLGTLTTGLALGSHHASAWLTEPVQVGLVATGVVALVALPLGPRAAAWLAWPVGLLLLVWINRVAEPAYLSDWTQPWRSPWTLNLHGVLRAWNGLWPLLALLAAARLARRPAGAQPYNRAP